jgi:hypothetical protein
MKTNFIVAQLIGVFGLTCTVAAVQQNKKNKVLIFQMLENFFYFLQYLFLNALSGAYVSFIGMFKSYIFYKYDKENKEKSVLILIIFMILSIIIGLLSYTDIFSLIPIITSIMYTYGAWQNDLKKFRLIALLVPIFWFIYNIYVSAYIGLIATVIEFVSAAVAIIRLDLVKSTK